MNMDKNNDTNEINEVFLKIIELENQCKIIETKMDKILELLEKDCKKMTDHIDFVENVYDNVKMPFNYLMNKVNGLITHNILHCDNHNMKLEY
jgi:hypothetical protein